MLQIDYRKLMYEDQEFLKYVVKIFVNATPEIQEYLKFLHQNYQEGVSPESVVKIIKAMSRDYPF